MRILIVDPLRLAAGGALATRATAELARAAREAR
jgi:hypothetical protein